MIYITPEEIEHLNEPQRVQELISKTYPDIYTRLYPGDVE